MTIHRYMVAEEYVHDWTLFDAIREVIANGLDAEIEYGTPCVIRYDKETIYIENRGAKIDVKGLYFGGTTKRNARGGTVGQYGEGLKLALLVFARQKLEVRVINDDETWVPSIDKDENGVNSFTITTRSVKPKGMVCVEIPGIGDDAWFQIQQLFLRLMAPVSTIETPHGTILLDPEYRGRRYNKGVYVDQVAGSRFGYNFQTLNVGRDRRSYRQDAATELIGKMWAAASADADNANLCYQAFNLGSPELSGVEYHYLPDFAERLLLVFRQKHGEDAYPVSSAGEGVQLEHTSLKPVTVPSGLCTLLRQPLKSIDAILAEDSRKVTRTYEAADLTSEERGVLRGILLIGEQLGIEAHPSIVDFKGGHLEGKAGGGQIYLARETLKTFGKALGVYIHEAAHLDGSRDGSHQHVDNIHVLMEEAFTILWQMGKEGPKKVGALDLGVR